MKRRAFFFISIFFFCLHAVAFEPIPNSSTGKLSNDSLGLFENASSRNQARLKLLNYSFAAGYGLSMAWLYTQWYEDYPTSSFHLFNDNSEWEQMDKLGHLWNAYNIAKPLTHCYQWAGLSEKKALLYGNGITFLFQTTIEVFDGFSSEWGFSLGDIAANLGGHAMFTGQQLGWHEQRMVLKFSFHETEYAKYNESLLGNSLPEHMLKDYNGMTYWLTLNPKSFFKNSFFPNWFSIGLGYGAEGMTGGEENATNVDGEEIPGFERYRQYYLSIDIDLARVKTRSKFLSGMFKLINFIHLPAPAIEWSPGRKPVYHGLYF